MNKKLLGLLIATESLFAVSCSQNWELPAPNADADAEEVTVTFSLSAEDGMASTRSSADEWHISDGTQIDKLVYAVYVKEDVDGEETYKLLDFYGEGLKGFETGEVEAAGNGQTVLKTDALLTQDGETITLRMMRGQQYVIGFWAQNSKCKAYDTQNLEKVVVDYTNGTEGDAPNNDEERDAFYQVHEFTAQAGIKEKVILKRAMAQINVGTAGWDYNDEVDYGNNYAYSKIVMRGLYDQLNVLTGKVDKTEAVRDGSEDKEITYTWAMLPAYIHKNKVGEGAYPGESDDSYDENKHKECADWLKKKENNTEYLYVRLTSDAEKDDTDEPKDANLYEKGKGNYAENYFLKYLEQAPETTQDEPGGITTEVFKYLSMCYVLAPMYEPAPEKTKDGEIAKGGTTISEVKFYLAEMENGKDYYPKSVTEPSEYKVKDAPYRFKIQNVPIQRNWRTNILGGTRGKETTLFDPRNVYVLIDLSPNYNGEHNYNGATQNDAGEDTEYPWTK